VSILDCEKCPIAKECGLAEDENKVCPLAYILREWRVRMFKKLLGTTQTSTQWIKGR